MKRENAVDTLAKLTMPQRRWLLNFVSGHARWKDLPGDCRAVYKGHGIAAEDVYGDWYVTDHGSAVLDRMRGVRPGQPQADTPHNPNTPIFKQGE